MFELELFQASNFGLVKCNSNEDYLFSSIICGLNCIWFGEMEFKPPVY